MEAGPREIQPLDDLGEAERALKGGNLTIAVVKGGRLLFSTSIPGLRSIFLALGSLGGEFFGSSVADKVVGRAAALLYAHYGARAVFGVVMSEGAALVLRDRGIVVRFDRLVPEIKGGGGIGVCPFERAVMGIKDLEEAVREISRLLFDPHASAGEG